MTEVTCCRFPRGPPCWTPNVATSPTTVRVATTSVRDAVAIWGTTGASRSASSVESCARGCERSGEDREHEDRGQQKVGVKGTDGHWTHADGIGVGRRGRSEEHTSELQSRGHLVCRLLLEKKKYMDRIRDDRTEHLS